ncbi:MAG: ribosome hibernation-promoting factor, HPF/YfiA family [Thermomicrobiales bacterium]
MELLVRGTDVTITPDLRSYATTRVSKLDRFVEHLVEAKLEIKRVHRRTGSNLIVAQLTIQTGRDLLRAEDSDEDAQKAINLAADKMETQVRKVNERRTARKKSFVPSIAIADTELDTADFDVEDEGAVVRTKRFKVQPLDIDEAIEQMELLGHDFFVFHNVDESSVNVIYRRNDGSYGLLVPLGA